jgi:hypothetical protein
MISIDNMTYVVGTLEGRQTLFDKGREVAVKFLKNREKNNEYSNYDFVI